MLVEILVVLTKGVAQSLELLWSLIGLAEVEGMLSCLVVALLHLGIGLQDIKHDLVSIPEEAVMNVHIAILTLLSCVACLDGTQQDSLRSLVFIQVCHVRHFDLLLLLSFGNLGLCSITELLNYVLKRANVCCLAHGAVLVQTLSGHAHLLEVYAQLQVSDHDRLNGCSPKVLELFVLQGSMKCLQSILVFTDLDELLCTLQSTLGLLESSHGSAQAATNLVGSTKS
mmetsp:Transcript_72695/g.128437  ORF Transcript_72695/g.128437 Transcript_72695/m.128437 type:complete len:227 (-) Transcript_72695:18-698(-)